MTDTSIRARIDSETKKKAASALNAMGLSISDAIRLLMLRIAEEQRIPFEIRVPNKKTQDAMLELEQGKGIRISNVSEMWALTDEED